VNVRHHGLARKFSEVIVALPEHVHVCAEVRFQYLPKSKQQQLTSTHAALVPAKREYRLSVHVHRHPAANIRRKDDRETPQCQQHVVRQFFRWHWTCEPSGFSWFVGGDWVVSSEPRLVQSAARNGQSDRKDLRQGARRNLQELFAG
jgi:hypothetical protein